MQSFFFHNSIVFGKEDQAVADVSFFGDKKKGEFFNEKPQNQTPPFFSNHSIQTKLNIGRPGDPYEREADYVADQVTRTLNQSSKPLSKTQSAKAPTIQRKCTECSQEEMIQQKREVEFSIGSSIRRKPVFESNEESIQLKCAVCGHKKKRIPDILPQIQGSPGQPSSNFQSQLNASKGSGNQIDQSTRSTLEFAFGADLNDVRIHTDRQAVEMNGALNAQAFTNGNDIYFNQGKYHPQSVTGQHLLAHELTHVMQQRPGQELSKIQKKQCDVIPEANNQFYGHGAFMGAGPMLMANDKWNRILQVLMPDVHADASKALKKGSDKIIIMFENNPVMAAFGVYRTRGMDIRREGNRSDRISKMKAIEWDAFLNTGLVAKYKLANSHEEREQLAKDLVDNLLIAHGATIETVRENKTRHRQYANVRKTSKSSQGGVLPGAWMDLFGRALDLAFRSNWKDKAAEYENPALHPRKISPKDQAEHLTFLAQHRLNFKQVIDLYKKIFGKQDFSVLLDIKSRDSTPKVLWAVIRELNNRGVHVYGIGTFEHHEIAGLGNMSQIIDHIPRSGPREVKFFHFAGDLQNAGLKNEIAVGDIVMFNAGSLISYDRRARGPKKKASYRIKRDVVRQLKIHKDHYKFSLGVYVQENDIDDRAARMITQLTNEHPELFNLGFAWGGLSGRTAADIEPSFWDGTVGTSTQFIIGEHWDVSKPLPSSPRPVGSGFESTIRIKHRYLKSREFSVGSGAVTVTCDADWNIPGCHPDTYRVSLVHEKKLWFNNELGTMRYPIGGTYSATWEGLKSGKYYLNIWFPNNTNPSCVLSGNIRVSV